MFYVTLYKTNLILLVIIILLRYYTPAKQFNVFRDILELASLSVYLFVCLDLYTKYY